MTHAQIWERSDIDAIQVPADIVMDPAELLDAALSGWGQGELVTIPSLPDAADWNAFVAERHVSVPNLSKSQAAARYK